VELSAELIVSHHPIMFRGIKRLSEDTSEGRMLLSLVRAGVSVYSPHTAFDNTQEGINDRLAGRLGLGEVKPLRSRRDEARFKIVVFVPDSDLARVSDAMFSAGAGKIGQYTQCSFRSLGSGTFFGSEQSNPTVGQKGRREEATEWRLEAVCDEGDVSRVVHAIRQSHSYEEPAFDVYPLHSVGSDVGEGRIGRLAAAMRLAEFSARVKDKLGSPVVQVVGDLGRSIGRVALVCGAGGEFLADAIRAGADVLVTGEIRFHDCLAAQADGLSLVIPGHYATERFGVEELAEHIQARWPALRVWASQREKDPSQWV
jgi:dinuclear metal center YbgI/SA1388 family protein